MRKATPAKKRRIRELRTAGASVREIAEDTELSVGCVHGVLKESSAPPPSTDPPPSPPSPPPAVSGEPVTPTELRTMLSKLARGLVVDAERARDASEAEAYRSHARQAMAAVSALAKLTPADRSEEQEGAVLVTEPVLEAARERAKEKFRRTLAAIRKERATWPRCSSCGQPVRPAEVSS